MVPEINIVQHILMKQSGKKNIMSGRVKPDSYRNQKQFPDVETNTIQLWFPQIETRVNQFLQKR